MDRNLLARRIACIAVKERATNSSYVTVHTAGRNEEHADEEILQNNSL